MICCLQVISRYRVLGLPPDFCLTSGTQITDRRVYPFVEGATLLGRKYRGRGPGSHRVRCSVWDRSCPTSDFFHSLVLGVCRSDDDEVSRPVWTLYSTTFWPSVRAVLEACFWCVAFEALTVFEMVVTLLSGAASVTDNPLYSVVFNSS